MSHSKSGRLWDSAISAVAAIGIVLALAACSDSESDGGDDPTPSACGIDFDCPVGQVCGAADADGARQCESAAAGADRIFGEVDLEFSSDEEYLVTVYTVPTDEAVADDFASFTLEGVGPNPDALTIQSSYRKSGPRSDDPYWRARLYQAGLRYDRIAALGKAMARGERQVFGVTPLQSSCDCGDTEFCDDGTCVESVDLTIDTVAITADVVGTARSDDLVIKVLVDQDDRDNTVDTRAVDVAQTFVEAGADVLFFLGEDNGHGGPLDRDDNGALTVVFTEQVGEVFEDAVGIFDVRDFLPSSDSESTGNEADILWARPPGGETIDSCADADGCDSEEVTFELAVATLSHEYQHLVSFARRAFENDTINLTSRETLWLDEGMSHTIEDLVGYGNSTQEAVSILFDPSEWFVDGRWASGVDSVAQRAMAFSLLRHIIDQRAKDDGATTAASTEVRAAARSVYAELLGSNQAGYNKPIFQTLGAQGISDWLVALYVTENDDVDESFSGLEYLPRATAASTFQTGFSPFAEFVSARGETFNLPGPPLGDDEASVLTEAGGSVSADPLLSQAFYYIVRGLEPGVATLRATGAAGVDFQIRAERVR